MKWGILLWSAVLGGLTAYAKYDDPELPASLTPGEAVVLYEGQVYHVLCWDGSISITEVEWKQRTIYTLPAEILASREISEELWIDGDETLAEELSWTPVIWDAIEVCKEEWTDADFDL
jgi:hypothetical protein